MGYSYSQSLIAAVVSCHRLGSSLDDLFRNLDICTAQNPGLAPKWRARAHKSVVVDCARLFISQSANCRLFLSGGLSCLILTAGSQVRA